MRTRRKTPRLTHRRVAAFHEAGHAVAREVQGHGGVARVWLEQRGRGMCEIDFEGVAVLATRPNVEGEMVCALAGPVAESMVSGEELWLVALTGGSDDYARFREMHVLATRSGWANGYDYDRDRNEDEARDLVREHWLAIGRIAESLVVDGSLTGARIRSLIKRCSRPARRAA